MEPALLVLAGLGAAAAIVWQLRPRRGDPGCPGGCRGCPQACRDRSGRSPADPAGPGKENKGGP